MGGEGLHKILESRGEGVAVYVSQEVGVSLGGSSARRVSVKIPKNKPRGFEIEHSILALGIEIPPALALPLRWRLELDHVAISRELKPQFRSQLEETLYCRSLFDVKPLLSSQGRRLESAHAILRASFDAAHPIVLRDASMFSVYKKPGSKQYHSAIYYSGALVAEPGSKLSFPAPSSSLESSQSLACVTLLLPSSLSRVTLSSSLTSTTVEGPGFRVVELPILSENDALMIEYHQSEMKFYPRKAVIADVVFMHNKLDAPKLSARVEKQELSGSFLNLDVVVENPDYRSVDEVTVSIKHGAMTVKEVRLPKVEGESETHVAIPIDLSKISIRPQRLVIKLEWVYEGVHLSSFTEIRLQ
ncbi:MAG: hypothetical protein QXS85_00740 [Acidilobaceae archaeon]